MAMSMCFTRPSKLLDLFETLTVFINRKDVVYAACRLSVVFGPNELRDSTASNGSRNPKNGTLSTIQMFMLL
jgi:hypothetical protein